MQRREFLSRAALAGGAFSLLASSAVHAEESPAPFSMKFAPHFGMFKHLAGEDLVDQLKFAVDQGFTA